MSLRSHLLIALIAFITMVHAAFLFTLYYAPLQDKKEQHKEVILLNTPPSLQHVITTGHYPTLSSLLDTQDITTKNALSITIDKDENIVTSRRYIHSRQNTNLLHGIFSSEHSLIDIEHLMKNHENIVRELTREPGNKIVLILIATFITSILLSIWLSNYITKPLKALYLATTKMDRSQQILIPDSVYRHKETGYIATKIATLKFNLEKQEHFLLHHSKRDQLTHLPNYQAAIETIDLHIRQEESFSIIRLSINDFRSINGIFGYSTGDQTLTTIANRMKELTTSNHQPFYLYNNEFLMLCFNNSLDENWLERFFKFLSAPIFLHNDTAIRPTYSSGIASFPNDGSDTHQLLRKTDIALNEAYKNTTRHEYFTDFIEQSNLRKSIIINDINSASINNELWMDYQPKVKTSTGRVSHFEALTRWNHPTLGLVFPDEFIEIAEQTGSIGSLSHWVMTHVCQQIHTWNQSGHHLSVAVNLSANDIIDETLPDKISTLMSDYELMPWQFSIEITESAAMKDISTAINILNRIESQGISLAIDDFGTGYSSLTQLKKLPAKELKIDKSFILRLNTEERNLEIVSSTVELGHSLGLKIIAEGVENVEAANTLAKMGCDFLQGYWIAKPMPAHQVIKWLQEFEAINFKS